MSTKFIPKSEQQKEQTYKVGDKIVIDKSSDYNPYILALVDACKKVAAVSLVNCVRWSPSVIVEDYGDITEAEINKIVDGDTFRKIEVEIKEV